MDGVKDLGDLEETLALLNRLEGVAFPYIDIHIDLLYKYTKHIGWKV